MINPTLHPWVTRIGGRLAQNLDPIALYVFGSSARNAPALGSDLDYLAIIAEIPVRARYQEALAAARGQLCIKIDLVCRTPAMLAADLEKRTSFVASIWSEAQILKDLRCESAQKRVYFR